MAETAMTGPLLGELDAARWTRRDALRCGGMTAASALITMPRVSLAGRRRESRVIETTTGKLAGTVESGLATFKGIPYGQSTAGRNRFLPPQRVKPWAGIRDATQLGHPSVQTNPDLPPWLDPMPGSEDCLVLNVWAPEHAGPVSKLPVMVWIHGGAYVFGSGGAPLYDGGNLARQGGVVAVSINHRLQAFGYTDISSWAGDDYGGSGNAGQLDIIAALYWVRTNIAAFGGDPDNVTLFGQSGGGGKICTLMGMPAAAGLFRRAILQSGSVFRCRERDEGAAMSDRMFAVLGIRKNDLSALQAVPAGVLLKCGNQIMRETKGPWRPILKYAPVVDGHHLPAAPWQSGSPEWARSIPLIIGSALDETASQLANREAHSVTSDEILAERAAKAATVYNPDIRRVAEMIPEYRKLLPGITDPELLVRLSTDNGFWRNAIQQAEMQTAAGAPVFMYSCDWKTPCFGGRWAMHAVELPFVFGHPYYGHAWDGEDTDAMRAAADPGNVRLKLGNQMLTAWTNFAKTGNPSTSERAWTAYDLQTRPTMIFDQDTRIVRDPRSDFRRLVGTDSDQS